MNKTIILSIINAIAISFIFNLFKKNIIHKQLLTQEDVKKYENKQMLLIAILVAIGTYTCFYVYENKIMDNMLDNNIEVKGGEPGF